MSIYHILINSSTYTASQLLSQLPLYIGVEIREHQETTTDTVRNHEEIEEGSTPESGQKGLCLF